MSSLITIFLTGCSSNVKRNTNFIYDGLQQNQAITGKGDFQVSNNMQIIFNKDGEKINIIKDPLFNHQIESIFVHDEECYYAYHVMNVLCFAKVDLRSFTNTLIYHSGEINEQDYFGTVNVPTSEDMKFDTPSVLNLFSDSKYIYYFTSVGNLYAINLQTRKRELIADDCLSGYSNYYYFGRIYYIDTLNQLRCYDTKTMKKSLIPHVYLESFKIRNNKIIYIDKFSSENKVIKLQT